VNVFAGRELVEVHKYIKALYGDSLPCLEEDLSIVSAHREFHQLLGSGLLERDNEIFRALKPSEEHAIAVVTVPYALSAADKLQQLGYRTHIYLDPNVLHSVERPTRRRDALLLWVSRQASLREGCLKAKQSHRHALIVAYLGDAPSNITRGLVSPEELVSGGVKSMSITLPMELRIEALNHYVMECRAKGIKFKVYDSTLCGLDLMR